MGNQPCKDCSESTTQNQAYGTHELIQQQTNYFAVVQKKIQKTQGIKQKLIEQLETRLHINNMHIAKLFKYDIKEQGYGYKTTMYYEHINKSLKDRILQIQIKDQFFNQREIFGVIYGVQAGLEVLKQSKIKHCCINLSTILVKNNIYKITDVSSTTYLTSYNLAKRGSRQQFLSQRLLVALSHQSLYPIYTYEDDLFSLGMVALCISADEKPQHFYNWTDNGHGFLKYHKILQSLKFIQKKYTSRLFKKIKSLLWSTKQKDKSQNKQKTSNTERTQITQKTEISLNAKNRLKQSKQQLDIMMAKVLSLNSTELSLHQSHNNLRL